MINTTGIRDNIDTMNARELRPLLHQALDDIDYLCVERDEVKYFIRGLLEYAVVDFWELPLK